MQLTLMRKNFKITQSELARKLFIDQTTVSKYEKGKITPPIDQLPKLAEILNCTIEELVWAIIETKQQAQTKNLHKKV